MPGNDWPSASSAMSAARATAPKPLAQLASISRRVRGAWMYRPQWYISSPFELKSRPIVLIKTNPNSYSLPPCGGGLGRGARRDYSDGTSPPHPNPPQYCSALCVRVVPIGGYFSFRLARHQLQCELFRILAVNSTVRCLRFW